LVLEAGAATPVVQPLTDIPGKRITGPAAEGGRYQGFSIYSHEYWVELVQMMVTCVPPTPASTEYCAGAGY
jgi:hypothetical protein